MLAKWTVGHAVPRDNEATLRPQAIFAVMTVLLSVTATAQQGDSAKRAPQDTALLAESISVAEAYPGLLQRAKVAPPAALQAALHKVKNGQLVSARIEERGQHLVYVFRVDEPRGQPRELLVDAETGRVLANRKLKPEGS